MRPAGSDISDPYGQPGSVAPVAIFIAFGERNAIMTTGYATSEYSRDEVDSAYELSFEVT
jgi:hypothetical protein